MPQFSFKELAIIRKLAGDGNPPVDIQKNLAKARVQVTKRQMKRKTSVKGLGPDLTSVRRVLKGYTHCQGKPEARGRKKKLSKANVRRLNTIRLQLIKKAAGEQEVHWEDVIKKARVPSVSPQTVGMRLREEGYDVSARPPREKPMRDAKIFLERAEISSAWKYLPENYFADDVDLIMDNKHFDVPTNDRAKRYARMRRVRFHLRTRSEGLKAGFTRPSGKSKHKINPGAKVLVCAAIVNCKVKVWEYLPRRWCAAAAADLYEKILYKALRRHRGIKKSYKILEDNDPTGYKSKLATKVKDKLGIKPITFPRYSPDLNPLDFFLWAEVERRMAQHGFPKGEGKQAYLERLRRTAKAIPKPVIRKALMQMKRRAKAIADARGGDIALD